MIKVARWVDADRLSSTRGGLSTNGQRAVGRGKQALTTATVAPTEQADRTITLPDAGHDGTSHASVDAIAAASAARPRDWSSPLLAKIAARALAMARPRLPLIATLVVLAVLEIRMIAVNTAFLDEATYLAAGHVIWHNWLHAGGVDMHYPAYFSGAPVIYPVIAAAADAVGGLYAARVLSLVFVLITVGLVDGTTRRLFGARAAGWAVVIFAAVEATQFLAAFATYDALALMLLALAVWTAVRFIGLPRALPHGGVYLSAPLLVLANATKYATALYDPVVIAILLFVVARGYGWRQARRVALSFVAIAAGLIAAALALAGSSYVAGINSTTLQRPLGLSTASQVLSDSARWVGPLAALCLIGTVALSWRLARSQRRSVESTATVALIAVLSAAVFLAPIEQARVHTTISLQKHVGFGAWFAAIAAGAMLSQASGPWLSAAVGSIAKRRVWMRWAPALVLVGSLVVIGRGQAVELHHSWPNSRPLIVSLDPFIAHSDRPVLMDDKDVPEYYLGSSADPARWNNTYYLRYVEPGTGRVLIGPAAYRSAIAHDHFEIVALNFGNQIAIDRVVERAVKANPHFNYLGEVQMASSFGGQRFAVWIDRHPEQIPWA